MRGPLIFFQSVQDRCQHTIDVPDYFVIPKSQDLKAPFFEPALAQSIVVACCVLPAVKLDNESFFTAYEICDVGPDRLLTDKFETAKRTSA